MMCVSIARQKSKPFSSCEGLSSQLFLSWRNKSMKKQNKEKKTAKTACLKFYGEGVKG